MATTMLEILGFFLIRVLIKPTVKVRVPFSGFKLIAVSEYW